MKNKHKTCIAYKSLTKHIVNITKFIFLIIILYIGVKWINSSKQLNIEV
jgi:hypothetical protein